MIRRRIPLVLALVPTLGLLLGPASALAMERLVLLPVVVHSAAPDSEYVSRGLSDMLASRIEQLGGLEVVRRDDLAQATTRIEEARSVGKELGGDFVVFGSFTQFGDGASLDLRCAPVQGDAEARHIFIQSGSMGEIIPRLDDLADKLNRYVSGKAAPRAPTRASAEAPAPAPAAANPGVDAAALQEIEDLRERLELLERAVFPPLGGAADEAAVIAPDEAPES